MLKSVLAISALATIVLSVPARAQTYDPSYPVCMHVYGDLEGDRIDCIFTSIPQCRASATGRPATCLINPYSAQAPVRSGRRVR